MHNFEIKILTKSYKDEAPTWAPIGVNLLSLAAKKQLMIGNLKTGTAKLIMVNLNGQIVKRLLTHLMMLLKC